MSDWIDARGCLTDAGLTAVRAAPPGQAPAELAGHLAGCRRCQYRLLSGGKTPPMKGRPRGASLGRRIGALAVAGLALLLLALAALRALPS